MARGIKVAGSGGFGTLPGLSRTKTTPIPAVRTRRRLDIRCLTSLPAGKMVPLVAFPLLREDRLSMSRFRFSFEMMETAEILMNAVNVTCKAYLVPNLAFDRFNGIDQLNRSYMKQPEDDGGTVTPFFQTMTAPAHGANEILRYLGKHARPGQTLNGSYVEAYNKIWNFRAANRSPDITPRAVMDPLLAKAFWQHSTFNHIVPDFDQAVIDGEVPVTVVGMPTSAKVQTGAVSGGIVTIYHPASSTYRRMGTAAAELNVAAATGAAPESMTADLVALKTEMETGGIRLSLANIEVARKSQAFAALRKQYGGHDDDWIIDMLMNGLTVPEQAWRQPILLGDRSTIFGMSKRYSSSADDLTASVVNGGTFIDMAITCPVVPMGGVVMIIAEVTPEQLFERQEDPYLHLTDQELLPEFLRDTLDPEKVEIVQNQYVDIDHDTPTATFGYAPLNHKWNHAGPSIGGKFFRPLVDDPFDEDRMRIWAVETQNPTLSEDFYLCTNMHTKVFVVTNEDPFEGVTRGLAQIEGLTVLGNLLVEASDDYEEVMSEVPMDKIDKAATTGTTEAEVEEGA